MLYATESKHSRLIVGAILSALLSLFIHDVEAEHTTPEKHHRAESNDKEKKNGTETQGDDVQSDPLYELMLRHAIPPSYVDISDVRLVCKSSRGSMDTTTSDSLKGPCILKGNIRNNHHRFEIYKMIIDVLIKDCVKQQCATLITLPIQINRVVKIKNSTYVEGPFLIPSDVHPKGSLKVEYKLDANWAYIDPAIRDAELNELDDEDGEA